MVPSEPLIHPEITSHPCLVRKRYLSWCTPKIGTAECGIHFHLFLCLAVGELLRALPGLFAKVVAGFVRVHYYAVHRSLNETTGMANNQLNNMHATFYIDGLVVSNNQTPSKESLVGCVIYLFAEILLLNVESTTKHEQSTRGRTVAVRIQEYMTTLYTPQH